MDGMTIKPYSEYWPWLILARYNRTDITLGHANVASTSWGQRQFEKSNGILGVEWGCHQLKCWAVGYNCLGSILQDVEVFTGCLGWMIDHMVIIYTYTYIYMLQPKSTVMESSIRDTFIFGNWAGAWKTIIHSSQNDNIYTIFPKPEKQ